MRNVARATPTTAPENFSFSWMMIRKAVLNNIPEIPPRRAEPSGRASPRDRHHVADHGPIMADAPRQHEKVPDRVIEALLIIDEEHQPGHVEHFPRQEPEDLTAWDTGEEPPEDG